MKKVFAVLGVTTLALGLAACGPTEGSDKVKIAMITDVGNIDDRSFNQGTWEGIVEYLEPLEYVENKDYKYFKPKAQTHADYVAEIENAITWGAEAVICPGFLFETAIYEVQYKYPEVKFLIEDGSPNNGKQGDDFKAEVASNTVSAFFKEQESGFLAGYAAVKDGNTDLGYMGGMAVPAVKNFGMGYVAGAYYAAKEDSVTITMPDNHYTYLGSFEPKNEYKVQADTWYKAGVDVIFAAAGGAGSSVMSAAEENNTLTIGVDVDQSNMSKTVLTSAKKSLNSAVAVFLDGVFDETKFKGGETLRLGVQEDGVSLPTSDESWRFEKFTKEQYESVYAKIHDGSLVVPTNYAELKTFVEAQGATLEVKESTMFPEA